MLIVTDNNTVAHNLLSFVIDSSPYIKYVKMHLKTHHLFCSLVVCGIYLALDWPQLFLNDLLFI